MLSKNTIKLIRSLKVKKYREKHRMFVAEGKKMVQELIASSYEVSLVCMRNDEAADHALISAACRSRAIAVEYAAEADFRKMSSLINPPDLLCLVKIPDQKFRWDEIIQGLSLALDNIRDPGNLGTLIRIADWFGIKNVICSDGCADLYNPKSVHSTMGSLTRVHPWYQDLPAFFREVTTHQLPVYGAMAGGENIYSSPLTASGIIILGSESHGISESLIPFITRKVGVPSFGKAESLNVSAAAAVICSEFRRRHQPS